MKKIELKYRKLLRKIFGGISLTAVAFVFQACYGHMQDDYCFDEICIKGKVVTGADTVDIPVQDIKVSVNGKYMAELVDTTNVYGLFHIYVPEQDMYNIRFECIEPDSISRFFPKDTIIEKPHFSDVFLNIRLDAR